MNKEIKIPKRLRKRQQWRGLPVPYITLIKPDGEPDFRVTDEHKRHAVMANRWCQLCGQPLGKWVFFVGGMEAAKANKYFEPAAHLDCLLYAMQVCPFIVGRIEHADLEKIQKEYANPIARTVTSEGEGITIKADSTFSAVRNPYWIIKKATYYSFVKTKEGTILCTPLPVKMTPPLHPETMTAADWEQVKKELVI